MEAGKAIQANERAEARVRVGLLRGRVWDLIREMYPDANRIIVVVELPDGERAALPLPVDSPGAG